MFVDWNESGCVVDGVATLRCIPVVFQNIITAALIFAGLVALFFIIFSGYKFMTSNADPKKVEDARKTFIYSILGLMLILLSFAIVRFVGTVTGVECINKSGFEGCKDGESNASGMGGYDTPVHDPIRESGENQKTTTKKDAQQNTNKQTKGKKSKGNKSPTPTP